MEISKDFNHRPIIFIRFNPDSYLKMDLKYHLVGQQLKRKV
jgi:hypothetical protein